MKNRHILATLALLTGGMIYICCRSECLLMFTWFEQLGIGSAVKSLRASTGDISNCFPAWFRFSLPNALRLFSGLLFLDSIWGQRPAVDKVFWLVAFWFSAVGSEFAQELGMLPGTFDMWDLVLMLIATVCAVLLIVYPRQDNRGIKSCSQTVF